MHGHANWIVPTPPSGDSSNRVANTQFVGTAIANFSAFVATSIASSIVTSFVASVTASTGLSQTNTTGAVTLVASLPFTSAALSGDVNLSSTTIYFDGPSVAQGTTGTWFVSGTVTLTDSLAGVVVINCKLWDGSTVIDSASIRNQLANFISAVSLSGTIASPVGNLRISCNDISATSGKILFNNSGNSLDSKITAVRIA